MGKLISTIINSIEVYAQTCQRVNSRVVDQPNPDIWFQIHCCTQRLSLFALQGSPDALQEWIPLSLCQLTELNIGNNILEEVPEVLKELKALKKLHLFGNRIQEIPPSLYENLTNLAMLNLNNNMIQVIAPEIERLSNLEFLGLRNNKIENIPVELCSLSKLSELHLTSNKLTTIPRELRLLTNLTQLHLARNQISELPESLYKLRKLRILDVAGNLLKFFPVNFNELMLEELYCEDNPFLQKEPVESIQQEEVLSLKEIAARFVMKELRNRQSCIQDLIAHYPLVKSLLSQGGRCALCGQGFLNIWLECVKFVNLKKNFVALSRNHVIPVRVLLCSYNCFNQQGHGYYGVALL
ncbi:leucine-rich repeat-containing protein 69 isoform X2 [Polypterus senegalus]|uniref:leucine-rich repeat-containing protein 69 isoform X2 n=1 Tax=Polypterus senegalus TaxID=55291 RepID=UPI0019669F04|nr:leucine-rich repeat-containing protein 69 isoform X2 [Polypterus senegalus]